MIRKVNQVRDDDDDDDDDNNFSRLPTDHVNSNAMI